MNKQRHQKPLWRTFFPPPSTAAVFSLEWQEDEDEEEENEENE